MPPRSSSHPAFMPSLYLYITTHSRRCLKSQYLECSGGSHIPYLAFDCPTCYSVLTERPKGSFAVEPRDVSSRGINLALGSMTILPSCEAFDCLTRYLLSIDKSSFAVEPRDVSYWGISLALGSMTILPSWGSVWSVAHEMGTVAVCLGRTWWI